MAAVVDLVERLGRRPRLRRHRAALPAGASRVPGRRGAGPGARSRLGRRAGRSGGRAGARRPGGRWRSTAAGGRPRPRAVAGRARCGRDDRRPARPPAGRRSVMGGELVALADIGYGAGSGRGGRWTTAVSLRGADLVTAGSDGGSPVRAGTAPLRRPPCSHRWASTSRRSGRPMCARRWRRTTCRGRVLFVGSLEPVKDPALAVRVFAALAADRPGLRLDVVGEGRLRGDLERLAASSVSATGSASWASCHATRCRHATGRRRLLLVTSRHEGPIDGRGRGGGVGDPRRRDAGRRPAGPGERRADRPARRRGGARRSGSRRCSTTRPAPPRWARPGGRWRSPASTSTGPAPT